MLYTLRFSTIKGAFQSIFQQKPNCPNLDLFGMPVTKTQNHLFVYNLIEFQYYILTILIKVLK